MRRAHAVSACAHLKCILFAPQVVSLDFGPANAGDVTANIMAPAPARACLSRPALLPGADPAEQLPPGGKPLPYLYLVRALLALVPCSV